MFNKDDPEGNVLSKDVLSSLCPLLLILLSASSVHSELLLILTCAQRCGSAEGTELGKSLGQDRDSLTCPMGRVIQ